MDGWLDRLRREIEETTAGLVEADWMRAPENAWNCSQIVEHLGRSYGGTAKMLESRLAEGASAPLRAARLSERIARILVVSLGRIPSGRKAPEFVVPHGMPGPVALKHALSGLERMKTALASAEQRWGGKEPVGVHFLLGPMTAEQWRKFHYLHGHHHVLQMRKRLAG